MTRIPGATTWPATTRYGLAAAPDALALAQELANTRPAGGGRVTDLLADTRIATAWLADVPAIADGASDGTDDLDPLELRRLVALREQVVKALAGDGLGAPTLLTFTMGGPPDRLQLQPVGSRVDHLVAGTLLGVRDAQLTGTWARLKECANDPCPCVFYDRSRNNSRVWHAIRGCGNPSNLRNSRRHRTTAHDDTVSTPQWEGSTPTA